MKTMKTINLLIGIITTDSHVCVSILHSIISYFSIKNLNSVIMTLNNDIDNGILMNDFNNLFSIFLIKDFDYLLCLRSQAYLNAHALYSMIDSQKDLIQNVIIQNPKVFKLGKEASINKTDYINFNNTLMSKKLAIDVGNFADDRKMYYSSNVNSSKIFEKEKIYDVFSSYQSNNQYISGFHNFCNITKELGYDIYQRIEIIK